MTTETQSNAGREESAAPAGGAAGMSEERYQQEAAPTRQVSPPAHAPIPGTKYVLNERTGLYGVHGVDDEGNESVQKGEDDLPEDLKRELAEKADAKPSSVELPDILPDHVRENPETQALMAEGVAAMSSSGEYNDEAMQRVVDLVAQFELEIGAEQPNLHEEERIRNMLKARWGSYYEGRLEKVNAFVNARPALKAYLNKTRAGNQLSVLEALSMVACGEIGHKPEGAAQM